MLEDAFVCVCAHCVCGVIDFSLGLMLGKLESAVSHRSLDLQCSD